MSFTVEILLNETGDGVSTLVFLGKPQGRELLIIRAGPRSSYRRILQPRLSELFEKDSLRREKITFRLLMASRGRTALDAAGELLQECERERKGATWYYRPCPGTVWCPSPSNTVAGGQLQWSNGASGKTLTTPIPEALSRGIEVATEGALEVGNDVSLTALGPAGATGDDTSNAVLLETEKHKLLLADRVGPGELLQALSEANLLDSNCRLSVDMFGLPLRGTSSEEDYVALLRSVSAQMYIVPGPTPRLVSRMIKSVRRGRASFCLLGESPEQEQPWPADLLTPAPLLGLRLLGGGRAADVRLVAPRLGAKSVELKATDSEW